MKPDLPSHDKMVPLDLQRACGGDKERTSEWKDIHSVLHNQIFHKVAENFLLVSLLNE